MLKRDELRQSNSCLNKAAPDEPVFVLRAKDPMAPQTVRLWAAMARGFHEDEKINEALAWADNADKWYVQNVPQEATSVSRGVAAMGGMTTGVIAHADGSAPYRR